MSLLSAALLLISSLCAQAPATYGELGRFYDGSRGAVAPTAVAAPAPKAAVSALAEPGVEAALPERRAVPNARGRMSAGFLGLRGESEYELTTGRCRTCNAPREGRWYFLDETIAVPKAGPPALIWLGSTVLVEGAVLSADGGAVTLPSGETMPLSLVPKIPQNRSYYDLTTAEFYKGRTLRLRGEVVEQGGIRRFVARTIWPEDWRLDPAKLGRASAATAQEVRWLVQEHEGGARSSFSASVLWERDPAGARAWAGKPVMGLMLNGGQGDDDETQAGHFSFFTGRVGPNGEMSDWLFSNFYDMDLVSEKGINAALVPLDKYMADLNSGQSFYRPSWVAVAVLKDGRAAESLQERYRDLYARYYAHEVRYDRAEKACTALIMDDLRAAGWNVPAQGPTDPVTAGLLALAMRLSGGRQAERDIRSFLRQEKTRLYPLAGFESATADLVALGQGASRRLTPFERLLAEDLEAVIFVRLPQIPSSRAFGRDPVGSTEEYFWRAPWDRSKWKTIPNDPRPFPPVPPEDR